MNTEEIKEKNIKLFKIYKPFAWDLLFYYAISFLFLVNVKGFSASQVVFADAFYPLFKAILQVICLIFVDKYGKKRCLIFGNVSLAIYLFMIMGSSTTISLIIANFLCAIGFVLKTLCESNILYDNIEQTENRSKIFTKIDGGAASKYYYLAAITAVAAGFLYTINPYIPLTLCFLINIFSAILSCNFVEIQNISKNTQHKKSEIKNIKQAFKFISHSKRLRSLILFHALFYSLLSLLVTMRRSLMTDINIPSYKFGIILAILGLIQGFSSSRANAINKKHKNHTLEFLGNVYILAIIMPGLAVILNLPAFIMYFIVLAFFTLEATIEGPYNTIITSYLNSFSTSSMRTKISSATNLIVGISTSVLSFFVSFLLKQTSTAATMVILGIISFIILLLILEYMKERVGLKPEEYSDRDIKFNEII